MKRNGVQFVRHTDILIANGSALKVRKIYQNHTKRNSWHFVTMLQMLDNQQLRKLVPTVIMIIILLLIM